MSSLLPSHRRRQKPPRRPPAATRCARSGSWGGPSAFRPLSGKPTLCTRTWSGGPRSLATWSTPENERGRHAGSLRPDRELASGPW